MMGIPWIDTPLLANVVVNDQLNDQWDFALRLSIRSGVKLSVLIGLHGNCDHKGHSFASDGNETINNDKIEGKKGLQMLPFIGLEVKFQAH